MRAGFRGWSETPIDLEKVKQHTKKFFTIFSGDDDVVPQENKKLFGKRLDAKTEMEHAKTLWRRRWSERIAECIKCNFFTMIGGEKILASREGAAKFLPHISSFAAPKRSAGAKRRRSVSFKVGSRKVYNYSIYFF